MPLTKLKELLGDNYSRALNNTDNRFVIKDPKVNFGVHESASNLYWMWPFESPSHVKSLIRKELHDHSTVGPPPNVQKNAEVRFRDKRWRIRILQSWSPQCQALISADNKSHCLLCPAGRKMFIGQLKRMHQPWSRSLSYTMMCLPPECLKCMKCQAVQLNEPSFLKDISSHHSIRVFSKSCQAYTSQVLPEMCFTPAKTQDRDWLFLLSNAFTNSTGTEIQEPVIAYLLHFS